MNLERGQRAHPAGPGRVARHLRRFMLGATAGAVVALSLAPGSAADATANLRSQVESIHRAAGCPAYQSDPVLEELALRNTTENEAYLRNVARVAPFENTLNIPLMQILRERGYNAAKAYLMVGYGINETNSIRTLVLQGSDYLPDCSYTKYGASELIDDSRGHVLTAVIVATN